MLHIYLLKPALMFFSSVQSLSCVWLFLTSWITAHQASLSFTISRSLLKLMSIESVIPSNHLILCCSLLLPSIFPSIRVFYNESALHIRWPKYWSFSLSINPSNEYTVLISFRIVWSDLFAVLFLLLISLYYCLQFSCSVVFDSLWPHEWQQARASCPSPTPGVHSNSRPSSRWCHPAISSSVVPFSSCPQSLPASGSFPMSQLLA